MVGILTLVTVLLWTASSVPSLVWFLADNETVIEMESPDSILVKSDYFWDPGTGLAYTNTFFYQVIMHKNVEMVALHAWCVGVKGLELSIALRLGVDHFETV